MKLLVREIKCVRNPNFGFLKPQVTTEKEYDVQLGYLPMEGLRNCFDYSSMVEVVSIEENKVTLKIKAKMRTGYVMLTVNDQETARFDPLMPKDGLVRYWYEFELKEVNL